MTWAWLTTSSAVVGSSAMSSFASQASASAMQTRWRCPPEKLSEVVAVDPDVQVGQTEDGCHEWSLLARGRRSPLRRHPCDGGPLAARRDRLSSEPGS